MSQKKTAKRNGNNNGNINEHPILQKSNNGTTMPVTRTLRRKKPYIFKPKNHSQQRFLDLIENNDVIFNIGTAGTGKTYVGVSYGIEAVIRKDFKKIVLVRPAIEACGEKVGFLPGMIEDKYEPYLQPVYDVLFNYGLTRKHIRELIEAEWIEICPLAYMRGRSLENCFVIIEEAQNMSGSQMEMLLTRIGYGSKFVITGDITQRDYKQASGIEEAEYLFKDTPRVAFIHFENSETLRSKLVQQIVARYADLREEAAKEENG